MSGTIIGRGIIALAILVATLLVLTQVVGFAGVLTTHPAHQDGSQVSAAFTSDFSGMIPDADGSRDGITIICDQSINGYQAAVRWTEADGSRHFARDTNGHEGGCGSGNVNGNGRSHSTCVAAFGPGDFLGCGTTSDHN